MSKKWTDEQLASIKRGLTWEQFHAKYPEVTYDSWEVKRRRVPKTEEGWTSLRIDRAIANNLKMARQVIRMRHSIEADDELSEALPRIRAALAEQAHTGQITGLGYDELRQLIYGQ